MRRRTGGSLLRTATSELTPRLRRKGSRPFLQPRLPDIDETSALTATALANSALGATTTPSSLPRCPHPHLPHRTVLTVRRATPSRPEARSNPLVAIARSIYPCSRSMRCASCARGFPYGAELRGMS